MNCNKCGSLIQHGDTVCPVCGTPAVSESPVNNVEQSVQPIVQPQVQPQQQPVIVEQPVAQPVQQPTFVEQPMEMPVQQPVIVEQPVAQPVIPEEPKPYVVNAPIDQMPQPVVSPMQEVQVSAQQSNKEEVKESKKKNKVNGILILIIVVLLLGIGCVGGYYLLNNDDNKVVDTTDEDNSSNKEEEKKEEEPTVIEDTDKYMDLGNYRIKELDNYTYDNSIGDVIVTSKDSTISYLINFLPNRTYDDFMANIDSFKLEMENLLGTTLQFSNIWYKDQQFMSLFNDQFTIIYTRYSESDVLYFTFEKLPAQYDELGNVIEPISEEEIMEEVIELRDSIVEKAM